MNGNVKVTGDKVCNVNRNKYDDSRLRVEIFKFETDAFINNQSFL